MHGAVPMATRSAGMMSETRVRWTCRRLMRPMVHIVLMATERRGTTTPRRVPKLRNRVRMMMSATMGIRTLMSWRMTALISEATSGRPPKESFSGTAADAAAACIA
ncbi:MAG: hypothetical protein ABSG63_22055 [Spirochaetia bacterium]